MRLMDRLNNGEIGSLTDSEAYLTDTGIDINKGAKKSSVTTDIRIVRYLEKEIHSKINRSTTKRAD